MLSALCPPIKDELLDSWIQRLAILNGFEDYEHFVRAFSWTMPYAKGLTENEKQVSQREFFLQFYNNLDIKNSATEVYLEMTCYGGLAPFLHKAQQAYYVNSAFRKRILGDAANSLTSSPRFCPECWNEFPAYYRRHQIPGVSVCSKHHCLLHMNQNGLDVPCAPNASWDIMERYAAFAEDILSLRPDADIQTTKKAIFKAIQEKNYYDPSGEYENLRMDMEGYGAFFENGLSKYLKETLLSGKYVPVPATIALVLFLFPSAEEFVKALEPQNDPLFEARLKEGEYELVGPVRHNLMEIRHNKCGEVHITTAYGFGHGWSCPACDDSKTDTEIYETLIEYGGNHQYKLLTPFSGMTGKVLIQHLTCGRTLGPMEARDFVQEGIRCKCENRYMPEQLQKTLDSLGDFDLVAYDGSESRLKIRHRTCGRTFECTYGKFMRYPWCKKCSPKQFRTPEYFREEVESDGTYRLLDDFSDYRIPVNIQHLDCGEIFECMPIQFLKGQRCPVCRWKENESLLQTRFYAWLLENYTESDVIFSEDIDLPEEIYSSLKSLFRSLVRKKALIRQSPGVFVLPQSQFTWDEIVEQRYISQRGHHVHGYVYGKSFAYQIGLTTVKPDIPYITTNKESQLHGRTISFLGKKVHIKGTPIPIDEKNQKILQFMSILPNLQQYSEFDTDETYRRLAQYVVEAEIDLSQCDAFYAYFAKWVPQQVAKIRRCVSDEKSL